ncbi:MAG: DUF1284 domain-containing protein, partial [Thermodesulfobacteriota bacterium]|nr:DUF1284 domain-containing protein [Thermodesulfobacteriota bacterium]
MNDSQLFKWRPHHILCEQFFTYDFSDRGPEFVQIEQRIKDVIGGDADGYVEIIEGADELCGVCPLCVNGMCKSPIGDEQAVRKWDGIVLKGLGLSYGEKVSLSDLRALIQEKA